ncbi:PTS lactose/cellobiose transporter subunit IIA [Collinsella sp. AGMB00827]|uniref:PTS lactose/cellobiose transporter subunit IIA n=1 Tax=Collinsella ureilytica TaxID=2869515 RepID=A0ABS7MJK7_9ACTN|nr:PTS lactose/cellobiose transporter subunit IIA [Collinsella urealyticum]MBY4797503.1 PTS lactose/cellobiose transporter subunit IIA [Collinsella urealyticum]
MTPEEKEELQLICFEIISYVGMAKSCFINAVRQAHAGDFDAADAAIAEGDEAYGKGHDAHMRLLQADAAGEREPVAPLILLHAEDQMASAETVRIMATELMVVHRELAALKA